jgi:crossover junction endodeoxyribonuclease RuvC
MKRPGPVKNKPKERIILGLDPGTNITGYGIIQCEGSRMKLLTYGMIHLSRQELDHPQKLKKIFDRVVSLVDEFHPDEAAIEAPFHGKNVQSMLKLGRAQGVAIAAAMTRDVPVKEYAPRKIKMAITGNGNASKDQVARMLERLLNFTYEGKHLDASDGIAAAVCHFFQSNVADTGKGFRDWSSFAKENPDRLKKR